jgi:hypothetical protein
MLIYLSDKMAVPWIKWLEADLSIGKPGFNPRLSYIGLTAVTIKQAFFEHRIALQLFVIHSTAIY